MIFLVVIGAPSIFKVLPRDAAGDVLGNIFPKYWIMGYICGIASLVTIVIMSGTETEQFYPWDRISLLTFMTVLTFYLGLVSAARARKLRLQIRANVDTSMTQTLQKKFRSIHRFSVILNVLVLLAGLAVIFLMVR
jgi:hypothetical protein